MKLVSGAATRMFREQRKLSHEYTTSWYHVSCRKFSAVSSSEKSIRNVLPVIKDLIMLNGKTCHNWIARCLQVWNW